MFDIVSKLFDRLVTTETGCKVFTGALDTGRYGIVWKDGANKGAHILVYEYHNEPVPEGLFVLHTCDNPPCCNEAHLFLGTKKDNAADMFAKGRAYVRKGEDVNTAKLVEEDILEIYRLIDLGYSQQDIGDTFGVSKTAIGHISRGSNWKHLYAEHRT